MKEYEAEVLATLLDIKYNSTTDLYKNLKNSSFSRGSKREKKLFNFFGLNPPEDEEFDVPIQEKSEGQYMLFEHQRLAVRNVISQLNVEPSRVLLHMPTGSGKTRTTMNVICEHLRSFEPTVIVWLATSEELCEQAIEEFKRSWSYLGNRCVNVYRYWGKHEVNIKEINDGFIVAGFNKIYNLINKSEGVSSIGKLASKTTFIVMDEAHQAIAPSYKMVLDLLYVGGGNKKLLGLSATPGRTWNDIDEDEKLANFFAKKKVRLEVKGYDNPIEYLTDNGYLAEVNFRQLFHDSEVLTGKDLEDLSTSIDIPKKTLEKLGQDKQRNLKILNEAEKLLKKHQRILIFAPSVYNAELLSVLLRLRGFHANFITGKTMETDRKRIIEDFKNDDMTSKVLCNFGVLTTGFDAPKTSGAIIARPTLSLVLYSQMVGRAIRGQRAGGNQEAEIVTLIDNELPGFGGVSEYFQNWEDVW
ncbi:DEAD/DEAH box helicase [Natranaerofaba carboxydovora]|uniref:DEAD/DEAH box helicase n=1 Tax=Natranaerofaba carboxydovora TaxID=2742683 RepID=UPI001F129324|nr:DEAD/DEAH box helicase [Natranaerofaba carboxydovora]UMZ74363.1 Putative DNA repair helicase RadD [Natranaerofaba carboxydovora]